MDLRRPGLLLRGPEDRPRRAKFTPLTVAVDPRPRLPRFTRGWSSTIRAIPHERAGLQALESHPRDDHRLGLPLADASTGSPPSSRCGAPKANRALPPPTRASPKLVGDEHPRAAAAAVACPARPPGSTTCRRPPRRSRGCAPDSSRSRGSRSSIGSAGRDRRRPRSATTRSPLPRSPTGSSRPPLTVWPTAPPSAPSCRLACSSARGCASHRCRPRTTRALSSTWSTGSNPLCGFLVPDHIDRGLAAHDPAGKLLGELSLEAAADDGSGARRVARRRRRLPRPPSRSSRRRASPPAGPPRARGGDPSRSRCVPELRHRDRRDAVDDRPTGRPTPDDCLTALAGRALALVRAKLALELDGPPGARPELAADAGPGGPAVPALLVPRGARLARRPRGRPGRVLRRAKTLYEQFHAVHVPYAADAVADPTLVFVREATRAHDIQLSFDRSSRCARHPARRPARRGPGPHTGLLPTTLLQLPGTFLAPAIAGLSVGFRAGPLLADRRDRRR